MRKCERNVLPFGRPWYRNQEKKNSSGPFVLGKTYNYLADCSSSQWVAASLLSWAGR